MYKKGKKGEETGKLIFNDVKETRKSRDQF